MKLNKFYRFLLKSKINVLIYNSNEREENISNTETIKFHSFKWAKNFKIFHETYELRTN